MVINNRETNNLKYSNTYKIHYYPEHIIQPEFKNRMIEIRVVVNETMAGMGEELKKRMAKKASDFNNIKDKSLDAWEASEVQPIDIYSTKIIENTKKITNGSIIYSIVLPLPNSFTDRGSHVWNPEISLINDALNKGIDSGLSTMAKKMGSLGSVKGVGEGVNTKDANGVISKTGGFANKITELFGSLSEATIKNSIKAVDELGASLGFRQPSLDPGYYQNYQRTLPRVFDLEFDLVASSAAEAEMIQNIILNLKRFTMPRSTVTGVSLLSPYTFEILFGNEKIQRLVNMSNVVCTSLDVNYSGDGNMMMFANGMPSYIKLILGFSEANVMTSEFYV